MITTMADRHNILLVTSQRVKVPASNKERLPNYPTDMSKTRMMNEEQQKEDDYELKTSMGIWISVKLKREIESRKDNRSFSQYASQLMRKALEIENSNASDKK